MTDTQHQDQANTWQRLSPTQLMEFAKRDDCLNGMVPSDLRQIIGRLARAEDALIAAARGNAKGGVTDMATPPLMLANGSYLNEPSVPHSVLEAFQTKYRKSFDLAEYNGEWGNTDRFKHSHIQSLWEGWRDSYIALLTPSTPAVSLEPTEGMVEAAVEAYDEARIHPSRWDGVAGQPMSEQNRNTIRPLIRAALSAALAARGE